MSGPFGVDEDRQTYEFLRDILGADFELVGGEVLEAGANIGTGSVGFVKVLGADRVHAFEPAPHNFQLLRQTVLANDLADRIATYQLALSNVVGEVTFELSPSVWGDHRVRVNDNRASGAFEEASRAVVRVPAVTIDALVDDGRIDLDKIKVAWIDIQGHEGSLLEGARSLLATNIPLVIEFWPYGLERGGGLDKFLRLTSGYYSHFLNITDAQYAGDGRSPRQRLEPTSELAGLCGRYQGPDDHTNLALFSLH